MFCGSLHYCIRCNIIINNLAGDPPKDTDPPAVSISTLQVDTDPVQVLDLEFDGSYVGGVEGSLIDFQKSLGMASSGVIDEETHRQLMSIYGQYNQVKEIISSQFTTDYNYGNANNTNGTGKTDTIESFRIEPEDVTRKIVEKLIANPAFVFATQHPYITQALTGVNVLGLFYAGGFVRDGNGVYHARQEWSLQSFEYSGYNDFYDIIFYYATSMNKAKFQFSDDDGNEYMLWAWKGDYLNLGAGAEMGIYKRMEVFGSETDHWLVDKSQAMPMTLTLEYNGKQIISYDPEIVDPKIFDPLRKSTDKWWVTGFNPYYQDVKASELKATYTVDFSNKKGLYDYFIKSDDYLDNKNKWTISEDNKYLLTFTFDWGE